MAVERITYQRAIERDLLLIAKGIGLAFGGDVRSHIVALRAVVLRLPHDRTTDLKLAAHRLDEIFRRESLVGIERRTHVLAPAAANARFGIKQIFPREVLQHANAHGGEVFVLDVDVRQRALRFKRAAPHIGRHEQNMDELRIHPVRDKSKSHAHMAPPDNLMRQLNLILREVHKQHGHHVANRRPCAPRIVGANNAQAFHHETAHADDQQQNQHDDIARLRVELFVHDAPDDACDHAMQNARPAKSTTSDMKYR